jgi:hypothetical protein
MPGRHRRDDKKLVPIPVMWPGPGERLSEGRRRSRTALAHFDDPPADFDGPHVDLGGRLVVV